MPAPLMDAARAWQHQHQLQPVPALAEARTPAAGQERPAGGQCLSVMQQYNASAKLWVLALLFLPVHFGGRLLAAFTACCAGMDLFGAPATCLLIA